MKKSVKVILCLFGCDFAPLAKMAPIVNFAPACKLCKMKCLWFQFPI